MYRLTNGSYVVRLSDGMFIADNIALPERQVYEEWLASGNVPEPPEQEHSQSGELLRWLRWECDRRLAALKAGYPDSEVLSWDKQEAEARAGGGPLASALAAARGLDEQELIRRILAKAEAFAVLSGTIIGQRQALEDQVRAGAVEVDWPG